MSGRERVLRVIIKQFMQTGDEGQLVEDLMELMEND